MRNRIAIDKQNVIDNQRIDQLYIEERSVDDRFMEKVDRLISENFHDFDFNVGSLHEMLGMSRVHLFRKMKALTGVPPSIYIRNTRLEKSMHFLLNKAGNLTEIANSVGISNPSYFTKCFKDYFGVSPRSYVESKNQNSNLTVKLVK